MLRSVTNSMLYMLLVPQPGLLQKESFLTTGSLLMTMLLVVLLQVLVAVLEHTPDSIDLVKMQEELVGDAGSHSALLRLLQLFKEQLDCSLSSPMSCGTWVTACTCDTAMAALTTCVVAVLLAGWLHDSCWHAGAAGQCVQPV
jgi:hypothetical protein